MATRSNTKTKNRDESDILDIFKDVLCSDVFKKIICEVVHQEISTLQETIKELRTEIADLRTVNQQLISNITNNKVISDPNVVPESKNPISSENNWSIVRNKSQKPYVRSAENTAMNEIRNVQQKKANTAIHNNDNNHQLIASPDSLSWCLDSSCPLKVINKPVGGRNNAWISDDIIRQSEYLKNLFWLMNNLQNPELKNIYDTEKRNYRSNISRAKRDYYANTINSASNKPKATWNIINSKLGKKNKQHNFILHVNGDIVSDKSSISAIFLESFSKGMPTKVVNHFSYNLSLPPTASPCILNSIFIQPTDTTEVAEVFKFY
nr:unnamed protein product [Callosobruchus analis]